MGFLFLWIESPSPWPLLGLAAVPCAQVVFLAAASLWADVLFCPWMGTDLELPCLGLTDSADIWVIGPQEFIHSMLSPVVNVIFDPGRGSTGFPPNH